MTSKTSIGGLSWPGILRLGLVQACLGGLVALTTSTLNRVMVVEIGMAAMIPAGLVALHYAVQLSRPVWGHSSDSSARRTPWILGGVGILGTGAVLAADATALMAGNPVAGIALGILAFTLIGIGVGLGGTTLLALLAREVAPSRRPAAASITWIMMIVGIVITAGTTGALLDPFSLPRLATVTTGVAGIAFAVSWLALRGLETGARAGPDVEREPVDFKTAMAGIWADRQARQFTIFVFVSMLAYSAQDLILEPFAGLLFGYSVGESTSLSGVQHGGVLLGMIMVGVAGHVGGGHTTSGMRAWIFAGCLGSALALAGLAFAAQAGGGWPLKPNVFILGLFNGMFAVSAIGAMMGLAGGGGGGQEGARMGLWGAAQAIAFGIGGFTGAGALDGLRHLLPTDGPAFGLVFAVEAGLFLLAAMMALTIAGGRARTVSALPSDLLSDADALASR